MASLLRGLITWAFLASSIVVAAPVTEDQRTRRKEYLTAEGLKVDLGYAVYQGHTESTTNRNVWKGYAAPPTGSLRWAAPQPPIHNRTVTLANQFGPNCPLAQASVGTPPFTPGDEDCLFLNVYAPRTVLTVLLPVLFWIHGGGYGYGDGKQDFTDLMRDSNGGFIVVTIQYRLGAFGFLASEEVKEKGALNAGILDIKYALEWVQKHIGKFGGDARRVTISGISAGGGAVMLLGIAEDGNLGTSLFQDAIAGSPYLQAQHDYNGAKPTQLFRRFAKESGCPETGAVLECLRTKDSMTLQYANSNISTTQTYGQWAFVPVTDYNFIKSPPSVALHGNRVNGGRILANNNANEGAILTPQTIQTLDDLKEWIRTLYPAFDDADVQKILGAYPSTDAPDNPNSPKFATNGREGAIAVNVSQVATGHQQRANNIYSEATFVCPSYWLNDAYASRGRESFHYQYSVPFAAHGDDVTAIFGPAAPNQPPSFTLAMRNMWGSFARGSTPTTGDYTSGDHQALPEWRGGKASQMLNFNTTGGTPYEAPALFGTLNVTQFQEPGLKNDIETVDAYAWEGGRGARCEVWRTLAEKVPM